MSPTTSIVLVGEAWGEREDQLKLPFVGASGQELTRMLRDAGLDRDQLLGITNVFNFRPQGNDITTLCGKKIEVGGRNYTLPALRSGHYVRPEYLPHLEELKTHLEALRPNLVVALGGTATWALLRDPRISKLRGTVCESILCPGLKVLPTFHPAAVLRQWDLRAIVVADLQKARLEATLGADISRPRREFWLEPGLEDIERFYTTKILRGYGPDRELPTPLLAYDIETARGQITCIGFAPDPWHCLCIPFVDRRQASGSYWPSPASELLAWRWVQTLLQLAVPKLTQNGLYDIQWLWRKMGISPRAQLQDTMVLHHALQPELKKDLGFLGSIYCNEAEWKTMRERRGEHTTEEKRDD